MTKILGLDLGVTSIGWALISENEEHREILGMGSRIIPLSTEDKDEFSKGNAISKNQARTLKRTMRKGFDRYQLRRKYLVADLQLLNMLPGADLYTLSSVELYGLRAKALTEKLRPDQIGRIFLHLNQRRGYKSARADVNLDKKDTEYVAEVKNRHNQIKELGLTIGAYFYSELAKDPLFRVKEKVFPREAYIEEFDMICSCQKTFHPELLSEQYLKKIRDEIIYFQRPLKSQKGLVSICEFEGFEKVNKSGKSVFVGPKVAPRSSPVFQVCKIWETINTIRLHNKEGDELFITLDQKKKIFEYLDAYEKLSFSELLKILGLNKNSGWFGNKLLAKGLQGNTTKARIIKCFEGDTSLLHLLRFDLHVSVNSEDVFLADMKTGEIVDTRKKAVLDPFIEKEPLYKLWHVLYSIPEKKDLVNILTKVYNLPENVTEKLAKLDFTKAGFGNKSVKAIRKILPYLMDGYVYSDACSFAGYNHSDSITKDENLQRTLLDKLPLLPKNSLRQPVVEKILNQMINVVNAVIDRYGKPEEIRIELARELKQSKDERNDAFKRNTKRERENETIAERLQNEYGLRPTRNNILKWRLFQEIDNQESKLNATCIYCGQPFGITQALKGQEVDVEHIIPRSRLFDDSMNNKTLSHRKCNTEKGSKTAFDHMKTKSESEFQEFLDRVSEIENPSKRNKLLMAGDKIPNDFIERQLRQTQYISRKSRELMMQVCRNVWATSGSVTEYLRRIWGWNDVTMNLNLQKLKDEGRYDLIETIEVQDEYGNLKPKEVIHGWTKRDDHRHHAIDALTIACTRQGFIQRINNLNSEYTKNERLREDPDNEFSEQKVSLEKYFYQNRPFSTAEVEKVVSDILISFKAGKKVATTGKRMIKKHGKSEMVQTGIIVPRGALSEESVYGKIKTLQKEVPLKKLFEVPDLIIKPYIKHKIFERLALNNNNPKKAHTSCKKEPIFLDQENKIELIAATIYREEYVIKYPLSSLALKDLPSIVDPSVKNAIMKRLAMFNNNPKEAFKDLDNNPVFINNEKRILIRSVRCFTGLSAVEPVKKDNSGKEIGFVKPGNNHHIAIYSDAEGRFHEHAVTFWHAVERKKFGLPVIIKDPTTVWNQIEMSKKAYPELFLSNLPAYHYIYNESLQQNEMFVFGFRKEEMAEIPYKKISDNLYRVQSISESDYLFRIHLETLNDKTTSGRVLKKFIRIKSVRSFLDLSPIKVKLDVLGRIKDVFS